MQQPDAEAVFVVVGGELVRLRASLRQRLRADGQTKVDDRANLPCVERRIEKPELDGAPIEHAMIVERIMIS